jgi:hypothetical protein
MTPARPYMSLAYTYLLKTFSALQRAVPELGHVQPLFRGAFVGADLSTGLSSARHLPVIGPLRGQTVESLARPGLRRGTHNCMPNFPARSL